MLNNKTYIYIIIIAHRIKRWREKKKFKLPATVHLNINFSIFGGF